MLAILEPKTFPKAISLLPFETACKRINNSGAEVVKETTDIPTTRIEIRIFQAKATDPLTNNSSPKKARVKLTIKQKSDSLLCYIKAVLNTFGAITNLFFNVIRRIFNFTHCLT